MIKLRKHVLSKKDWIWKSVPKSYDRTQIIYSETLLETKISNLKIWSLCISWLNWSKSNKEMKKLFLLYVTMTPTFEVISFLFFFFVSLAAVSGRSWGPPFWIHLDDEEGEQNGKKKKCGYGTLLIIQNTTKTLVLQSVQKEVKIC